MTTDRPAVFVLKTKNELKKQINFHHLEYLIHIMIHLRSHPMLLFNWYFIKMIQTQHLIRSKIIIAMTVVNFVQNVWWNLYVIRIFFWKVWKRSMIIYKYHREIGWKTSQTRFRSVSIRIFFSEKYTFPADWFLNHNDRIEE